MPLIIRIYIGTYTSINGNIYNNHKRCMLIHMPINGNNEINLSIVLSC